jgi:hypothetical protein
MSTLANPRPTTPKPRHAAGTVVATFGALIAVGVTVLFLAVSGTSHTRPTPQQRSAETPGLGQYPGTGVPRTALRSRSGWTTSGYLRPEKSHGAVP